MDGRGTEGGWAESTRIALGTFVTVKVHAESDLAAASMADRAFEEIVRIEELMSPYLTGSELYLLNSRLGHGRVQTSDEIKALLVRCLRYSRISEGAFDVTIGPVSELWGFSSDSAGFPEVSRIEELLPLVGYSKLDVSEKGVKSQTPGMKLDLGGAAKGYAVDRALELLRVSGAKGALVNSGGDLGFFGIKPDGKHWRVAIAHPRDEEVLIEVKDLGFEAVATSGDYQRFFIRDGVRYHHILDPATGFPARACVSSTVWAQNVTDADILSTAVFVMGPERGLDLIESLDGCEALVFFEEDGKLKHSFSRGLSGDIEFGKRSGEGP